MAKTSRLRHVRHNRFRGLTRGHNTNLGDGPVAQVDTGKRRLDVTWEFFVRLATQYSGTAAASAVTFTVGTDQFALTAHGLRTGMPVILGGTTVPTGFTAGVTYYVIVVDANNYQLAATQKDAFAGVAIDGTNSGVSVTSSRSVAAVDFSAYLGAGVTIEELIAGSDIDNI